MAVIELTASQAELAAILIREAFEALERHQRITQYSDEQCIVLIEMSKKKRLELDERLAGHYK